MVERSEPITRTGEPKHFSASVFHVGQNRKFPVYFTLRMASMSLHGIHQPPMPYGPEFAEKSGGSELWKNCVP